MDWMCVCECECELLFGWIIFRRNFTHRRLNYFARQKPWPVKWFTTYDEQSWHRIFTDDRSNRWDHFSFFFSPRLFVFLFFCFFVSSFIWFGQQTHQLTSISFNSQRKTQTVNCVRRKAKSFFVLQNVKHSC